jgi:hypothetical protein
MAGGVEEGRKLISTNIALVDLAWNGDAIPQ